MTTSVGEINFGVGINAKDLADELRAAILPALNRTQQDLSRRKVKISVDTSDIDRAKRVVDSMTEKLDTSRTRQASSASRLREEEARLGKQRDALAAATRAAEESEARLEAMRADSTTRARDLARAEADATAQRQRAIALESDLAVAVERVTRAQINRDSANRDAERSMRSLAEAQRAVVETTNRVAESHSRIRAQFNQSSDASRTLESSLAGVGKGLQGVAIAGGAIGGVSALVAAIGGAAGAALGSVGGLAAGLAALGPATAGIAGTAVVGLQGMKDTFSALFDLQKNAASEGRDQAEQVAAAQEQVAAAREQVTSAIASAESADRSYSSAQRDVARATEDVGRATRDAEKDLRNYQLTADEASLSVKEADLALQEAQDQLNKAKPEDRTRALLRIERAQINLTRAQQRNAEAQEENNDAQAKGAEGADRVVAAKDRVAEAEERAAEAGRAAEKAHQQVAKAQEGVAKAEAAVAKAASEASPSQQKFNDLLAQLSPEAQGVVLAVKDLMPTFTDLRNVVQDAGFEGLGSELRETADVIMPTLREGMVGVAGELNNMATGFLQFLRSAQGVELINASLEGAKNLLVGLRQGTGEATSGFVDFSVVSTRHMEDVGNSLVKVADDIGRVFTQMSESGQLDTLFTQFADVLDHVGPMLADFTQALANIAEKVMPALGPFLERLGQTILDISPALGDLGAVFLDSLTVLLPVIGALVSALAEGLKPVLPVLVQLFSAIGTALIPVIDPLSQVAVIIGETLAEAINALAPSLPVLVQAFADILNAISPLIPMIAENLSAVLIALAPAISEIAIALAPVIAQFAQQMIPVIREMAPILAEVALQLGLAIADAIRELAPYIPELTRAFTDVLLALLPLLPELTKLAVEVIPIVVDIIKELLPFIINAAESFAWLCNNVLVPIVLPILREVGDQFGMLGDIIDGTVGFITETVFPALERSLERVLQYFRDTVGNVREAWSGITGAAADPVNFVINAVWNNGLLKAWQTIDGLLGGALPDAAPLPEIPRRATGGPLLYTHGGSTNWTKDDILLWGSNNEHMITAAEVAAAGGHDVVFAIRDMIARGIPFTWDNGQVVDMLGRENLSRYGSQVAAKGIGNVPPEGLFDQLLPKFQAGGPVVMPWMHQLKRGHDFARAQDGRPYKWAGPQFVGDSFDCSGFIGSTIAAILGLNTWQRYWATSSFSGYPARGAQGLVRNLLEGAGMLVGITDDPGGPGGGHTAGELRAIPELGIQAARVESGGALGNVHYGRGTPVGSFASLYGLPIGANGFFEPSEGVIGGRMGPSPEEQRGFLEKTVSRILKTVTDPLRENITRLYRPPPSGDLIPISFLGGIENSFLHTTVGAVDNLGGAIGGAWQKAQDLGEKVLDLVNPFDSGGVASGKGFLPKNIIAPERVLDPEQTVLFEALVRSLQQIAGAGAVAGAAPQLLTADVFRSGVAALAQAFRVELPVRETRADDGDGTKALDIAQSVIDEAGRISTNTADLADRSESSQALVINQQTEQLKAVLDGILRSLTADALIPIMRSAVDGGVSVVEDWLQSIGIQITKGTDRTTAAVKTLELNISEGSPAAAPPPFGAPGSAFDATKAISDAVVSVANTASSAFNKIAQDVANAALAQKPSKADPNRGVLGRDISGGTLVDMIVQITGVEIQIRDNLVDTYKEIVDFRADLRGTFDETGRVIADTAELVQRNESSRDLVISEQARINRELVKAVIKYLVLNVLLPIITAILGAMITLATTAIGAAIGSMIPVIGTAIGAAIGAVIGSALSGLAAVFVGALAVGAGAALDSFDSGGRATGIGFMPKNVIAPERVLNPRNTESFDRLVDILDEADLGRRNTTINMPFKVVGGASAGQQVHNDLLSLLNG